MELKTALAIIVLVSTICVYAGNNRSQQNTDSKVFKDEDRSYTLLAVEKGPVIRLNETTKDRSTRGVFAEPKSQEIRITLDGTSSKEAVDFVRKTIGVGKMNVVRTATGRYSVNGTLIYNYDIKLKSGKMLKSAYIEWKELQEREKNSKARDASIPTSS